MSLQSTNISNVILQETQENPTEGSKSKKKRTSKKKVKETESSASINKAENGSEKTGKDAIASEVNETIEGKIENGEVIDKDEEADLEDGECSDTASESDAESCASTATDSDDDSVAKHHPPCMRVIVRETKLPKLKVGSLFLITKDGGTVGREGAQHAILLNEHNVSRNHLQISYDSRRRGYVATDLGSKNGTTLNGTRMSASQVPSQPMEVPHGSTIQLGVTKLLCHIHPGNDTCGHCEPGLIMEAQEKEKKIAYTRTCSVQKQHALELARLKNKYVPEPLAIEDGSYKDRAKERREAVGSSHHSEKTQQSDLDTSIAPDNKGFKLLQKMGWSKGEGLGKDSQGEVEPVPLVSNESKVGLGAAGSAAPVQIGSVGSVPLKMNRRSKPLRPPARLFRDPLEDDDE
ncbi:hypothetical protein JYU34_014346 [Plutella xylostella]|uniref:Angiogenic factor with G patch and FHA domains 1 n=1 Tax=Plutella xylostella TaxID=51655 RepID=A0ABQ7Q831_PLUXY|nr:hypothetical protein JYU34_014346 [Plutella xylostella]